MDQITCPSCGTSNPTVRDRCQHCDADLTSLKSVINTANRHYNSALELAREDKTDEAIRELETALELWDANPNYYNVLGTCYAKKGRYAEARRAWQQSLALNPAAEKAHSNIEKVRKLDPDEDQPVPRKSGPLPWIVAAACLLLALGAAGYAVWQGRGYEGKIASLTVQGEDAVGDLESDIEELQASLEEYEILYTSAAESRDKAQEDLTQLRQAMEVAQAERADLYLPRTEHEQALQAVKQEAQKKEAALQQQIAAIRQQGEKEKAELNTAINTLRQEKEQITAQMENLRNASTATTTQVAELQEQLQALNARRDELEQLVHGYEQDLQAAQEAQELQIAELQRLKEDQQKRRERLGQLTQGLRSFTARDFASARTTADALLETDAGDPLAQILRRSAEEREAEWTDPLNVALRQQREFATPEEEEELRAELADRAIARSRAFLEQRDYTNAYQQAQLAVDLQPADAAAVDNLNRVQAVKSETDIELRSALETAQGHVRDGNLFTARSVLRETAQRFPHHPELRSTLEYVEDQAAQRDRVLTRQVEDARPLLEQENFEQARSMVTAILEENPNNEAALAYQRDLNESVRAARDRQVAEHLRAAREAMAQGRYSEARRHVNALLELAPENQEAQKLSAELGARQGSST